MALDEATRVRLGSQPLTTPEVLRELATDGSVTVRAALAMNPGTPPETDAALVRDADERVRALLARKLGSLVPSLSATAKATLRQQVLEMLTALAEDAAVRVRAALADVLKDLPEAPRAIIARLAHDASVMVSEPVIRFSPLLTSADLVALVVAAPSSGTRLAVARRPGIDAAVSDAVVAGGTDDAVLALLNNQSAQLRETTLDALVQRAAAHPDWHEPLVRRPALSARSLTALTHIVADHLLEVLAARSDIDPALTLELRARLSASSEAEPTALAARPTEADLLEAARAGDARRAAMILAIAADLPLPVVRRASTLRSAKGLVSLTWKAGFSMKAGHAMQVLLGRLPPGTALKPGPCNAFPLSVQEMVWQIDFLSGKER